MLNPRETHLKPALATFGYTLAVICLCITLFSYYKYKTLSDWHYVMLGITLLLSGTAFLKPMWLHPVEKVFIFAGNILGWINLRIILALVFYGVVTPIGLIRRAMIQCGMGSNSFIPSRHNVNSYYVKADNTIETLESSLKQF